MRVKDDLPAPRIIHRAAVQWAQALEKGGYVGLPANRIILESLGADIINRLDIAPSLLDPLLTTIRSFFDETVTRYGLYRCGLYIYENATRMQSGKRPRTFRDIASLERRLVYLRVINVLPGDMTPYGSRNWTVTALAASEHLAGLELQLGMPEKAVLALMRDIPGLIKASEGYVEYLSGMWIKVLLGRRPPARGICIIASEKLSSVLNSDRIQARQECKHAPCHKCPKTMTECRWSIKPSKKTEG